MLIKLPLYIGKGKYKSAWSHLLIYDHHKSDTIIKIRKRWLEPIVCILKKNPTDKEAGDGRNGY